MIQTITASSWEELVQILYSDDWDASICRHRSSYAFRGMVDSSWEMKSSLMRIEGEFNKFEKHLLRNFQKYAHRDVVERDSFWNWLTVAQHHGLPTRLLDWTYSPFVALHFATDDLTKMETDGIVWCAKIPSVHKLLPKALSKVLTEEGSYVFTVDMLSRFEAQEIDISILGVHINPALRKTGYLSPTKIRSLDDFDQMAKKPFALFFEPPSLDDRIVNQFALFSVLSSSQMLMDDWLKQHSDGAKKVIIPKEIKWKVRDKLDQANITERVIYPGLDGLGRWLKRHYSPSAELKKLQTNLR